MLPQTVLFQRALRTVSSNRSYAAACPALEFIKGAFAWRAHQESDETTSAIVHVCSEVIRLRKVPSLWKEGIIVPVLKPGKPKDEAASYRPIQILHALRALIGKMMAMEVSDVIKMLAGDDGFSEAQFGFREGRSTEIN